MLVRKIWCNWNVFNTWFASKLRCIIVDKRFFVRWMYCGNEKNRKCPLKLAVIGSPYVLPDLCCKRIFSWFWKVTIYIHHYIRAFCLIVSTLGYYNGFSSTFNWACVCYQVIVIHENGGGGRHVMFHNNIRMLFMPGVLPYNTFDTRICRHWVMLILLLDTW